MHHHKCDNWRFGCPVRMACSGRGVRNDDGWPTTICEFEGQIWLCEECAIGPVCEDCGFPAHLPHIVGCPWAEKSH